MDEQKIEQHRRDAKILTVNANRTLREASEHLYTILEDAEELSNDFEHSLLETVGLLRAAILSVSEANVELGS
jgi:hypothetical protein